jgi:NAD(P)-dependent dehydrogenase (short-subunit alcohol dehydrogenase family)
MNPAVEPDPSTVFSLAGEHALISGGGTGLGFAMAQCFVRAGACVTLVGRRKSPLEEAVQQLGNAAFFLQYDITLNDHASSSDLLQDAEQHFDKPISILVNNAGNHLKKAAVDTTPDEFDQILQTHIVGAQRLTRMVLPGMLERRHGSILFIASMSSMLGIPYIVAYSAAKAACLGMVRSLAAEVSARGVRVNAIAPGWIETPMLNQALDGDPERKNKILSRTPMKRFGESEDIGWAATFLCSPAAKFITGVTLPIDGGASIGF